MIIKGPIIKKTFLTMKWLHKIIINNVYNLVSNDLDSEKEENLFDQEIIEDLEVTPKTILNTKVLIIIYQLCNTICL